MSDPSLSADAVATTAAPTDPVAAPVTSGPGVSISVAAKPAKGRSYAEINALKQQLRELQVKVSEERRGEASRKSSKRAHSTTRETEVTMLGAQRGSIRCVCVARPQYDNQQLLLGRGGSTTDHRSLESGDAGARGDNASSSAAAAAAAAAEHLSLQQSNHALQSAAASLESALQARMEEVDLLRLERSQLQVDLSGRDELIASLRGELGRSAGAIESLRSERSEDSKLLESLSRSLGDYESRLETLTARNAGLEANQKTLEDLQADKTELEGLVDKLREVLLQTNVDANAKVQDLLNKLSATRQFLEELKNEYESFASCARLESEAYAAAKSLQVSTLMEQLDTLKLSAYESARDMHQDQVAVIEALQSSYGEYRSMVEALFMQEARALEDKLASQGRAFDAELRHILQTKEAQFHAMCTAKDAKILNLIEGTDFSRVLLAHQNEVEQLLRDKEQAVDLAREQALQESKKSLAALRKDVIDKTVEIDKYHTQILTWEHKLDQTLGLLKKQKKIHQLKEEAAENQSRKDAIALREALAQIDSLRQVKETLRHRLLRLRLQIDGSADASLPSVLKRLTKETQRLSRDLQEVSQVAQDKSAELEALKADHRDQSKTLKVLEGELETRAQEFKALTKTLEGFLHLRLRGGVVGGCRPGAAVGAGPQSLYDPAVTKALVGLSQPFLQALFHHRDQLPPGTLTFAETMLRGTSDQPQQPQQPAERTMVGLRLGVGATASPQASDDVDESKDSDLHRQQAQVLGGGGGDGSGGVAASSRRSTGMQSTTSSAADLEASMLQQLQQVAGTFISGSGSSSASTRSSRPQSTLQQDASSSSLASSQQHTRHVSLNSAAASSHAAAASGGRVSSQPSPSQFSETDADSHHALLLLRHQDPHQQQQQSQQSQQSQQPHAPGSSSSSRSSRLHDLIHFTPSVPMPPELRRPEPPRSLQEQLKREKEAFKRTAAAAATAAAATTTQQQEEDGDVEANDADGSSSARRPKKGGSRPRFAKSAKLAALESGGGGVGELVDMDLVRNLERGFLALEKFKALSRDFEADAKGRVKRIVAARTSARARARAASNSNIQGSSSASPAETNTARGVGAFGRDQQQPSSFSAAAAAAPSFSPISANDAHASSSSEPHLYNDEEDSGATRPADLSASSSNPLLVSRSLQDDLANLDHGATSSSSSSSSTLPWWSSAATQPIQREPHA